MIGKFVLLSLLVAAAQAQTLGIGPCPKVEVVQDFDVAKVSCEFSHAFLPKWKISLKFHYFPY